MRQSALGCFRQSAKLDRYRFTHMTWQPIDWIKIFADFFGLHIDDAKSVYELFLGNRVNDWPHPFGELAPWVAAWDTTESWAIRDRIIREKGWDWNSIGAKILQNEIYRRTPEEQRKFHELRQVVSDHLASVSTPVGGNGDHRPASPPRRLLDYGCGTANFIENLLDLPELSFVLMDVDPVVVNYCRYKFRRQEDRVTCCLMPMKRIPEGDQCRVPVKARTIRGRFDIIHCVDVLEHTLDPLRPLMQMTRALPPGGLLIFHYDTGIEGTWHTPEAHYLRPFCMAMVHRLFRQSHDLVYVKACSPWMEQQVLAMASAFHLMAYPVVRLRARHYFRQQRLLDESASLVKP